MLSQTLNGTSQYEGKCSFKEIILDSTEAVGNYDSRPNVVVNYCGNEEC
jgi:hypothetical protein